MSRTLGFGVGPDGIGFAELHSWLIRFEAQNGHPPGQIRIHPELLQGLVKSLNNVTLFGVKVWVDPEAPKRQILLSS